MNKGFDTAEIAKVKEKCRKAGQLFIFNEDEESDENAAHIYFVGKYDGKEVVYDAFIYTLEMEYNLGIYEEAKAIVMEENPKLKEEDFDLLEGKHIERLDEIADELSQDSEFDVQEFLITDDDTDYGISLNACFNWESITKENLEQFIKNFNEGKLELDETFYSFSLTDEE